MLKSFDERRDIAVPGDNAATIQFAARHWVDCANRAIGNHRRFAVALSGGSTPQAIFQTLASPPFAKELDWKKVFLFWSDERATPPDHPDSNYGMAIRCGLSHLGIPSHHIFRMKAEHDIEANAREYERLIQKNVGPSLFDLVMLGVGEDGHTASLFPHTKALDISDRLVAANYVPEKKTWRMTFTFRCINESRLAVIYALGESKERIVRDVLHAPEPSPWPASRVGTPAHKALWILDRAAAKQI